MITPTSFINICNEVRWFCVDRVVDGEGQGKVFFNVVGNTGVTTLRVLEQRH